MVKRFFVVFSVTLAVLTAGIMMVTGLPSVNKAPKELNKNEQNVITISNGDEFDSSKALESRFLNMLNHNFVYNESFYTEEAIVNESVKALLDMKEDENSSFIAEGIVADYVSNMYGIKITDFGSMNSDFPQKEGFVYIIPRGYSEFKHEIISVKENEDGSYTVKTNVSVATHDDGEKSEVCETLFVKNEASQFGFCIIRSDISAGEVFEI